ncbi:MAG: ABC transporter substrate-binding protein [Abditibacteriaceae bacterium]
MRNKPVVVRIIVLFILILLFSFGITSCQLRMERSVEVPQPVKSTFPTDDVGREILLQKPAQRVAVIGPGATETIFQLGLGSRIVGRDQISNYPSTALKIPIIGNYTGPFYEKIVAAHPDLLIMQGETWNNVTRLNEISQKIGAPVAALTATNLKDVSADIRKIGAWLGVQDKSDKLALPLDALVKTAPKQRATAFVEISRSPLWAAGSDTLVGDAINLGGFKNVADVTGYKQFSMESLLVLNPDVYIVPADHPDPAKVLSSLQHNPQLGKLPAIKEGHVIVIDGDLLLRPSTRLTEGITVLRKAAREYHK